MKKTIFTLFTVSLCVTAMAQAPVIEWQKTFGGSENELFYSVYETADGGYIAAGYTGSTDGDVTENKGDRDALLVKFAANGSVSWHKTYGGTTFETARSIIQTAEGGYIFTGSTNSTDGDVASTHGGNDVWVVKLDNQGVIEWEKTYGGTSGDAGYSIVESTGGGYVVGGQSNSADGNLTENNGMTDLWVFKIDEDGTLTWQTAWGGSDADYGRKLIETSAGDIVVVGYSSSNNGDLTENKGAEDGWILKLSETGSLIWQKSIGGTGSDYVWDVIENSDGAYILAGSTTSSNGDVSENKGGADSWIVELDEQGTIEWEHTFGGSDYDEAYQLAEISTGQYAVIGTTTSDDHDVAVNKGEIDAWIFVTNASGTLLWEKTVGSSSWDGALAGQATTDGGFIIAGYAGAANGDVTEHEGQDDTWVVKLKEDDLGLTHLKSNDIVIFPNTTNGKFVIKSDLLMERVNVYSTTGVLVATQTVQPSSVVSMDIESLSTGNYLVEMISGNATITKTVVKK